MLFSKSTIKRRTRKSAIFAWYLGIFLLCIFQGKILRAQNISGIINIYAQVLDVDTCLNQILVGDATGFNIGDRVLLIQMKGATIDETNTASFGTITDYGNAGNYEFGNIAEINGLFITLKNKIVRLYNAPEGFVQLVRVPQYGDVTVAGKVTALPWDGTKGGVVVFEASGNVNLNADINVDTMGFHGGADIQNGAAIYDLKNYYYSKPDSAASKGEGIAEVPLTFAWGRGPLANGGGGGDGQNSGGGGGANGGTGGEGGDQGNSNTYSRLANGGLGGKLTVSTTLATDKIFFGGGGGAGQMNDNQGTSGGDGGGIIIIRANTLTGGGGKILSNGANAKDAIADGAGGGGAGGTIVLDVNTISNNPSLVARGGSGGNNKAPNASNQNWCYAPGGGGSGGIIVVKGPSVPPSDVSGGKAGLVTEPTLPCYNTTLGATDGANGGGIWNNIITDGNVPFTYPRITKNRDTICQGDFAQLGVTGSAFRYVWSPSIGLDNDAIANPKASPTVTTMYAVTIYFNTNCQRPDSVLVVVNPRPTPKITGKADVCQGQPFSYSIIPFPGATYSWTVGGGNIISGQGTESLSVQWNTLPTGNIHVDVTASGTECFGEDSLAVNIHPAITPAISGGGTICNGDSLQLTATPASFMQYLWSTGDTIPSIQVKKSGKYFLQTVSLGGCTTYSDTITVIVNPIPVVTIIPTAPVMADTGGIDTLYLSSNFKSQIWGNGATTDTIFILDSGTYTVAIIDSNGCPAKAQIYIPRDIKPPSITLSIDSTLQGSPCDVITIPINIDTSYNMPPSGATNYITEITFDESILSPLDKSNYVIKGRWGTLTINGTRGDNQIQGLLTSLKFGVALGDTTATPIIIKTFIFTNGKKVLVYHYNGLFKLTNLCQQGGTRLFAESDSLLLKQNVPNPASGSTSITYSLLEEGNTKLWISDLLGRSISTVFDSWLKPGEYSVSVNTSSFTNGNYFYILQTPTAIRRRMMRIEK